MVFLNLEYFIHLACYGSGRNQLYSAAMEDYYIEYIGSLETKSQCPTWKEFVIVVSATAPPLPEQEGPKVNQTGAFVACGMGLMVIWKYYELRFEIISSHRTKFHQNFDMTIPYARLLRVSILPEMWDLPPTVLPGFRASPTVWRERLCSQIMGDGLRPDDKIIITRR